MYTLRFVLDLATRQIPDRIERRPWLAMVLVIIMLTGFASGCSFVGSDSNSESLKSLVNSEEDRSEHPNPMPPGEKVRWDGGGVILGNADNLAFTPSSFRKTMSGMITESKLGSARALIDQYPDVALTVLQQMDPGSQELEVLEFVAKSFDQRKKGTKSNQWHRCFVQLSGNSRSIEKTSHLRQQFWQHLKKYEPNKALQLGLVKSLDRNSCAMLQAECHRLEAIAFMMNDKPRDAVRSLKSALAITEAKQPFLSTTLRLLLGEFYRHNRQFDRWKSTWETAVNEHSQLLIDNDLYDPQFWNRAAYLRPAKTDWPRLAVQNHLAMLKNNGVQPNNSESVIWCSVGYQHLMRSEGQVAVLAFKKSEALASAAQIKTHLQLQQARAMIIAGQPGPSSAILIRLISEFENQSDLNHFSDRCKAILGTMKLQNGGVMQGLNLIQSAIETVDRWPRDERLRTQADYALALLMRGRQDEGIPILKNLHQKFSASGRWHQAHQCLWNITAFYEKTDQKDKHRVALRQLHSFERN